MTRQLFRACVNLDAGNDTRIGYDFNKGSASLLLLTDRFVVEDHATNALTEIRSGHNQLPVSAPTLLCLGNPQPGKAFIAGWITFIHRQQALIVSDQLLSGVYKLFRIHLVAPLPVPNFRKVLAVFVDILLVLDKLVFELLL